MCNADCSSVAAIDSIVSFFLAGESGGGDGDDDGGDGTGYSIDDLVAEDADDAGGSYNRGGGVAA